MIKTFLITLLFSILTLGILFSYTQPYGEFVHYCSKEIIVRAKERNLTQENILTAQAYIRKGISIIIQIHSNAILSGYNKKDMSHVYKIEKDIKNELRIFCPVSVDKHWKR